MGYIVVRSCHIILFSFGMCIFIFEIYIYIRPTVCFVSSCFLGSLQDGSPKT